MLKSVVLNTLILQLILSPFAFAQQVSRPLTFTDLPTNNLFLNDPTFGSLPTQDPWSIGNDPNTWDPNGTINDPSGLGDGINSYSPMGFGDDAIFSAIASGVMNEDYEGEVVRLRTKYPINTDDEIADILIEQNAKYSGQWGALYAGAGAAAMTLGTNFTNPMANLGVASLLTGAQMFTNFSAVFRVQSGLILTLAALYGDLPKTGMARMNLVKNNYISASLIADTINLAGATGYEYFKTAFKYKEPIDPNNPPNGPIQPNIDRTKITITPDEIKAAGGDKEVAMDAKLNSMQQKALEAITHKPTTVSKLNKWFPNDFRKYAAGAVVGFLSAVISYKGNSSIGRILGKKAKINFQLSHHERELQAAENVALNAMARKALFLLLTRDVLNKFDPAAKCNPKEKACAAQLKAAGVSNGIKEKVGVAKQIEFMNTVSRYMPFVRNPLGDELKDTIEAYRKTPRDIPVESDTTPEKSDLSGISGLDTPPTTPATKKETGVGPKMIDQYLKEIGENEGIETRLEIMKILFAGIYVKGYESPADITTIKAVGMLLNLRPSIDAKVIEATDRRNYVYSQLERMHRAIAIENMHMQQIANQVNQEPNNEDLRKSYDMFQKCGSGCSIIMEDLATRNAAIIDYPKYLEQMAVEEAAVASGMNDADVKKEVEKVKAKQKQGLPVNPGEKSATDAVKKAAATPSKDKKPAGKGQ